MANVSTKRAVAITVLVCLTPIVSHVFGRSLYSLLLPAIKSDLSLTNTQAGLPSSATFLLYVVGVLIVVFASARAEPVTLMRVALVIGVIGLAFSATADDLVTLTIGVSLVGGAGAGIWMTAPILATEYVSEHRRGLVIGALTSAMGLGNIAFGFGTTAWRSAAEDEQLWRPIWWIALVITAILLVGMVGVARFAPTDSIGTRGIDLSIIRKIPRWREVTVAYSLFGGMSAGFGTFIVAALEEHGGVASSTSTLVFSLMGIAGMVAAPVAGALSDRVGRLTVLRGSLAILVVANLCVSGGGAAATILGAVLYSAGASTVPALVAAHVRDSLTNRSFSQALATMTILFSIMAAIMPAVVGRLGDISFRWSYLVLAGLPITGLLFLTLVRSDNDPHASATQTV